MPHKFNAKRRDKIPKQKFKVTNWPVYNKSLRRRGDLTISASEAALCLWFAARRKSRGGQPKYSDLRSGSVCLNSCGRFVKWTSASLMPPPSLVSAR